MAGVILPQRQPIEAPDLIQWDEENWRGLVLKGLMLGIGAGIGAAIIGWLRGVETVTRKRNPMHPDDYSIPVPMAGWILPSGEFLEVDLWESSQRHGLAALKYHGLHIDEIEAWEENRLGWDDIYPLIQKGEDLGSEMGWIHVGYNGFMFEGADNSRLRRIRSFLRTNFPEKELDDTEVYVTIYGVANGQLPLSELYRGNLTIGKLVRRFQLESRA
jgi:hypothetical protein